MNWMNLQRATLVLAIASMTACVTPPKQYDTNSGGDENRKTARQLFPGQNVTDSLNDPGGDHTDWKEVRVRENGNLGITVAIDDLRGIDGYISIKDGFGVELERRPINSADSLYNFDKIPVYQGEYYIQVFFETGKSTYTVGAVFDPLNKGRIVAANPQNGNLGNTGRNGGAGRNGGNGGKGGKNGNGGLRPPDKGQGGNDTGVTVTPDKGLDSPGEDDQNARTLRGRIARIVPIEGDNGGSQIIISGFGSNDGVTAGMKGTIVGLGKSFRVTVVRGNGATAITRADAVDLEPYKTVLLKVKIK